VIHEEALQIRRAANLPLMRPRSPSSAALKRASSLADANAQINAGVQGEGGQQFTTRTRKRGRRGQDGREGKGEREYRCRRRRSSGTRTAPPWLALTQQYPSPPHVSWGAEDKSFQRKETGETLRRAALSGVFLFRPPVLSLVCLDLLGAFG
jgi:hypothetical protein